MALTDFPKEYEMFKELEREKERIIKATEALRREYDGLKGVAALYEAKARIVAEKIRSIQHPELANIDNKIASIARSTGGYSLNTKG